MGLHDGRVVIVTGAAGGIGREHALEFARQGARVVVNDVGPVDDVLAEIKELGGQAVGNDDDVSDWDGAGRLVQTALDTFGDLHVLVNNAGILRDKMFVNMDVGMWDDVMQGAPARHLLSRRGMPSTTGGRSTRRAHRWLHPRIINTSSPSGLYGNVGQSNYGAAKAAHRQLHGDPCRRARPAGHHRERDRAERAHPDDRGPRRVRHEDGGDQGAHRLRRRLTGQHRPDRGLARLGRGAGRDGQGLQRQGRAGSASPRPGSPDRPWRRKSVGIPPSSARSSRCWWLRRGRTPTAREARGARR